MADATGSTSFTYDLLGNRLPGEEALNVFVLCTGRCGSVTFARACRFIDNYTAGHETAHGYNLEYPDRHIEVDNRLSWFLGRLDERYPDAYYVHLLRRREDVVQSFARRGCIATITFPLERQLEFPVSGAGGGSPSDN